MPIRIVISDDHSVFRSGLRTLLEKEPDFEVVGEADSGADTLQTLSNTQTDVLILDISMPGISGTEVARAVLEQQPQLPIVILTMHEDEYYLREFFEIGVRAFLLKKSTATELFQAVRAVQKGDYYIDSSLTGHVINPFLGKSSRSDKKPGILTSREQEICRLLAFGHTNTEIADKLNISGRTVETHRTNIMSKLGLKSRANLVRYAIDNGLMKID